MEGLVLVSVLFAHMMIPIWAAQDRSLGSGLRKFIVLAALFDVGYVVALHFIQVKISAGVLDLLNSGM